MFCGTLGFHGMPVEVQLNSDPDSIWPTILSGLGEDPEYPKMVVSNLTSSMYWDIGENYLSWTHLRPNSRLSQRQNEFIDVFTISHRTSNRHIQLVMKNLTFIILRDLAVKKSGILDWRRNLCDRLYKRPSIWKVIPSRHITEYNTVHSWILLFTSKLNTDQ